MGRLLVVLAVLGALAECYGLTRLTPDLSPAADTALTQVIRGLTAGLFTVAGGLGLLSWRLSGRAGAARSGCAGLLMGSALAVLPLVAPSVQTAPELAHTAPAARLLFTVPAIVLLAGRRRTTRPVLLAGALLTGWLVATILLAALSPSGVRAVLAAAPVWEAAELGAALAWLGLALRFGRHPRLEPRSRRWIGGGLVLLALSEVLKAWAIGHPTHFAASLDLQCGAAFIGVGVAWSELRRSFHTSQRAAGELARDLAWAQARLHTRERRQQERIHDARSAVAGVLGAARLLAAPETSTDSTARLHRLMTAELLRLQETLDDRRPESMTDYALDGVLAPVLAAHELAGGRIDPGWSVAPGLRVHGRPIATASAVANLLTNARIHAPGASVRVRAESTRAGVRLIVEDDGPGFPAEVTRDPAGPARGRRGSSSSAGSGLGLYSAARALAEQGGRLEVGSGAGGGARVTINLPAAALDVADAS